MREKMWNRFKAVSSSTSSCSSVLSKPHFCHPLASVLNTVGYRSKKFYPFSRGFSSSIRTNRPSTDGVNASSVSSWNHPYPTPNESIRPLRKRSDNITNHQQQHPLQPARYMSYSSSSLSSASPCSSPCCPDGNHSSDSSNNSYIHRYHDHQSPSSSCSPVFANINPYKPLPSLLSRHFHSTTPSQLSLGNDKDFVSQHFRV